MAFIVLQKGTELTEKEVIDICRNNLPDFAVPACVEFFNELPKGAIGKILKYKLKNQNK